MPEMENQFCTKKKWTKGHSDAEQGCVLCGTGTIKLTCSCKVPIPIKNIVTPPNNVLKHITYHVPGYNVFKKNQIDLTLFKKGFCSFELEHGNTFIYSTNQHSVSSVR
jgi:hypothetical protein